LRSSLKNTCNLFVGGGCEIFRGKEAVRLAIILNFTGLEDLGCSLGLFCAEIGHRPLYVIRLTILKVDRSQRNQSFALLQMFLGLVKDLREVVLFRLHQFGFKILDHLRQVVSARRHVRKRQLASLNQCFDALFNIAGKQRAIKL